MKAPSKVIFGSLMLSILATGCNDNSSTESKVKTDFAVTGSGQDAVAMNGFQKAFSYILPSAVALTPPALVDLNGSSVNLDEAWIALKHIQFKSTQSDDSDGKGMHYNGPFYVDLLSDQPLSFGEISLPKSSIRRVKMLLHKGNTLPADVPSQMQGKSIYLNGSVNSHNFVFVADETTDIQISGPKAIVPEEGKDLLAVIRLADMLKKIDLSVISADTTISASSRVSAVNPCPEIHPTASDLYTCFRKGLAQEAKFGKDNGDQDLDSSDEVVNE